MTFATFSYLNVKKSSVSTHSAVQYHSIRLDNLSLSIQVCCIWNSHPLHFIIIAVEEIDQVCLFKSAAFGKSSFKSSAPVEFSEFFCVMIDSMLFIKSINHLF